MNQANMSTMARYLPRDFPTADPPPEPTDPHSGEICRAFAVQESRRMTELTARISIVILPTDYPSCSFAFGRERGTTLWVWNTLDGMFSLQIEVAFGPRIPTVMSISCSAFSFVNVPSGVFDGLPSCIPA
jgi:hypothetical protein